MPKKLIISDSAGVCFGVEKAVTTAEEVLNEKQPVQVVDNDNKLVGMVKPSKVIHILFGKTTSIAQSSASNK